MLAYQGHLNLALVIIIGTLAELAGSYVSYAVGRVAERPVIERLGRYLLITRRDISRAEHFLARPAAGHPRWPGDSALRSFTSLVAGFAGVLALRFGVLSLIGTVVYVAAMSSIGYAVGPAWNRVASDLSVAGYVTAAVVVVAVVAFVIYRLRELRRESAKIFTSNGPGRLSPPHGSQSAGRWSSHRSAASSADLIAIRIVGRT